MKKELRYIIIGAGMAGILAGIKLLERGEKNFTILEKAASLGGTWRENRYPGLTCDVPAHAYTYSFAPNPEWSSYYATGEEIRRYFVKVADDYGVAPYIRYNSEVVDCAYDEASATWTVEIAGGEKLEADIVICASGVLHHPKMPDIAGLDSFEGRAMHSARWDENVKLDGARVGIVENDEDVALLNLLRAADPNVLDGAGDQRRDDGNVRTDIGVIGVDAPGLCQEVPDAPDHRERKDHERKDAQQLAALFHRCVIRCRILGRGDRGVGHWSEFSLESV